MKEKILKKMYKLSTIAFKKGEVPVSAVVVKNNKIVSYAYNKREKNNDILGHAEIIALSKASKKLRTWKLNECDLYVTLKPCSMCDSIIRESRIKNVYYLLNNDKVINNKIEYVNLNSIYNNDLQKLLTSFFSSRR